MSCGATGVSDAGGAAGIEPVEVGSGDSMEAPGGVASPFEGAEALESGLTNIGAVLASELCDEHAQHTSASAASPYSAHRPNEYLERMPEHLTLLSRREPRVDGLRADCGARNGAGPKIDRSHSGFRYDAASSPMLHHTLQSRMSPIDLRHALT
jgi:hypothetical protein